MQVLSGKTFRPYGILQYTSHPALLLLWPCFLFYADSVDLTLYTHKLQDTVTLTPQSSPCVLYPHVGNIHEIEAQRFACSSTSVFCRDTPTTYVLTSSNEKSLCVMKNSLSHVATVYFVPQGTVASICVCWTLSLCTVT